MFPYYLYRFCSLLGYEMAHRDVEDPGRPTPSSNEQARSNGTPMLVLTPELRLRPVRTALYRTLYGRNGLIIVENSQWGTNVLHVGR